MPVNGISDEADLLDTDDYNPLEHLNVIFTSPASLSSASKSFEALQAFQVRLDDVIDDLETQQELSNAECIKRMQASKAELAEMFKKIDSVRERAIQTEKNITEMTAEIKQLDNTKKNLTLSMTALKRLQMLTTAYEQLRVLSKTRQYKECAQLLQAVIQLMAHFKSYRSIDQIASLSRNVADLQRELLEQVCEDFEIAFAKGEAAQKKGMLAEACLVMDALGDSARSRLITWYCNTQLREYRQVFRGNDEAGSLENISRRYSWFRRMLKTYDEEHSVIFPVPWRVSEVLANVFAEGTREDYKGILSRITRSGQNLEVKILLACLQETLEFEHSLDRKFANTSRASIDTMTSGSDAAIFNQSISDAFEPYLSVWVDAQDRELQSMIQRYKQQPPLTAGEEFSFQQVISSSTELFNFYRHSFAQCAKLATGSPLSNLSKVFARYLDQYAQQVLLTYISERPTIGTPSRTPTVEDTILVLNTADYCYNTSAALEEKIKSRIDESFRELVDLQNQADAFMGIASASIRGLVRLVEVDLEPSWREMRNIAWSKIESCADQSSFVNGLVTRLKDKSSQILSMLHKQQYARAFADNLIEPLVSTYIANIAQCKPISEGGAEQMLLDTHAIRSTLTSILPTQPPPPSFVKRVAGTFGRIEPLLKTLQVRPSPPEALIQAYLIHIADLSDANFRKVLELKGIRSKNEQTQLVELFQMHKLSERYKTSLVEKSPLLTQLNINTGVQFPGPAAAPSATLQNLSALGNSAAASLSTANLPSNIRFDPSGLGNAIMDRFSSPHLGASGIPREDAQSSPTDGLILNNSVAAPGPGSSETGAKINENLKNIGKFFRRDFGRFASKGTSSVPDDRER